MIRWISISLASVIYGVANLLEINKSFDIDPRNEWRKKHREKEALEEVLVLDISQTTIAQTTEYHIKLHAALRLWDIITEEQKYILALKAIETCLGTNILLQRIELLQQDTSNDCQVVELLASRMEKVLGFCRLDCDDGLDSSVELRKMLYNTDNLLEATRGKLLEKYFQASEDLPLLRILRAFCREFKIEIQINRTAYFEAKFRAILDRLQTVNDAEEQMAIVEGDVVEDISLDDLRAVVSELQKGGLSKIILNPGARPEFILQDK